MTAVGERRLMPLLTSRAPRPVLSDHPEFALMLLATLQHFRCTLGEVREDYWMGRVWRALTGDPALQGRVALQGVSTILLTGAGYDVPPASAKEPAPLSQQLSTTPMLWQRRFKFLFRRIQHVGVLRHQVDHDAPADGPLERPRAPVPVLPTSPQPVVVRSEPARTWAPCVSAPSTGTAAMPSATLAGIMSTRSPQGRGRAGRA